MRALDIKIDISDTVQEFSLTDGQTLSLAESIKGALVSEIYRQWSEQAELQLNSTRQSYIRGLNVFNDRLGVGGVRLVGALNNMIERGVSAFDMKTNMEKSAKKKISKRGDWYLRIPFRWATPDAMGESEVFAGNLPKEIYNIIKSKPSGYALKSSDLPKGHAEPNTRKSVIAEEIGRVFEEYTHKSPMFEGLTRSKGSTSGSTYNTMRTVGKRSSQNAWIHSGIKEYNLLGSALNNVNTDIIVNNTADKVLSELGF